jgi:glutaconate CoA-transferase subunit B
MKNEKRRFVEKLDYFTSPGWINGEDSRNKAGFKRGGPLAVVTNLGVMKFDDTTKKMYLDQYYSFSTPEQIANNIGFEIDISRAVSANDPDDDEIKTLRENIDPQKLIL